MTPQEIAGLGPALTQFLRPLYGCFSECRLLDHFEIYCRGLLCDLDRKSVEPIAPAAGSTVRAPQVFLSHGVWDHQRLRDLSGAAEDQQTGLRDGAVLDVAGGDAVGEGRCGASVVRGQEEAGRGLWERMVVIYCGALI
jgi:hypothetical protein